MKQITLLFLIVLTYSCQTYREISPTISGTSRKEFELKSPLIIALKDTRQKSESSVEIIDSLKSNLKSIYGQNITFRSYYDKTKDNEVALKINIKEIGASFGIRSIQYQVFKNQVSAISSSVLTNWGIAVSTAIVSQPIVHNQIISEGYWIGTSYLEIELVDNLNNEKLIYSFPFAGEDVQSNTWGYKTARKVAENSWYKVSSQLLDLIDSIAMRIIESE